MDRPMADRIRETQVISIQEQPVGHMGVEEIIRQWIIESTEGGKAKEILKNFHDTPELLPFLDKKFQDWLKQKAVLKILPKDSETMQFLRDLVGRISTKKKIPQIEQFLLMLKSDEGYFVSLERVITVLEGDRWDLKNMGREGSVYLPAEKVKLKHLLRQGLGHLMTDNILFQVNNVGIGVGIKDFKLNHQEISLLNRFYSNPGIVISQIPYRRERRNGRG